MQQGGKQAKPLPSWSPPSLSLPFESKLQGTWTVCCVTTESPGAKAVSSHTELFLPTRWDSSNGTHNIHHVPLDTVIWTVSLLCLRWVSNPGPACPKWLSYPAPAPSTWLTPKVATPLDLSLSVTRAPGGNWPSNQCQTSQVFSTKSGWNQDAHVRLPLWLMAVLPKRSYETFNLNWPAGFEAFPSQLCNTLLLRTVLHVSTFTDITCWDE